MKEVGDYTISIQSFEDKALVIAIGLEPNRRIWESTPGIEVGKHGTIKIDENLMTSTPGGW